MFLPTLTLLSMRVALRVQARSLCEQGGSIRTLGEVLGERSDGGLDARRGLFRRAQRRVERQHFRGRRILLYHEKQRKKMQREMGQDPYLDTPE